jgi:hypothetical protein
VKRNRSTASYRWLLLAIPVAVVAITLVLRDDHGSKPDAGLAREESASEHDSKPAAGGSLLSANQAGPSSAPGARAVPASGSSLSSLVSQTRFSPKENAALARVDERSPGFGSILRQYQALVRSGRSLSDAEYARLAQDIAASAGDPRQSETALLTALEESASDPELAELRGAAYQLASELPEPSEKVVSQARMDLRKLVSPRGGELEASQAALAFGAFRFVRSGLDPEGSPQDADRIRRMAAALEKKSPSLEGLAGSNPIRMPAPSR